MLNANALLWVEALEKCELDGVPLKQGYSRLTQIKNGVELDCCLGAGCKVYMKYNPGKLKITYHDGCVFYGEPCRSGGLPQEVREWLGLKYDFGNWNGGSLIICNDDHKLTFPEIAQIIRSEPQGLFANND